MSAHAVQSDAQYAEREELLAELTRLDETEKTIRRKAIIAHRRLDILSEILGLTLMPMHRALQRYQLKHPKSLQLAFRGSGKTTAGTVVHAIWHVCANPNVRILIASKTGGFATDILSEIRAHLEQNDELIDLFGPFKTDTWSNQKITVAGRTLPAKEATITTVGVGGQVVGKHYDVIFGDDLVDEDNSRTLHMRNLTWVFFHKTLMPTLEPWIRGTEPTAKEDRPYSKDPRTLPGEIHLMGTRYHYDDLYGRLMEGFEGRPAEYADCHNIIPALDGRGRSPWPQKWPATKFVELRGHKGIVIFNSQYQCDTEAMRGEIFDYDWMVEVPKEERPKIGDMRVYVGVDLAIGQSEQSDFFAIVAIGTIGSTVFVLESFKGRMTFPAQVRKVAEWYDRFDPVGLAIETVAYQDALAQQLKHDRPDITRVRRIKTGKDKVTRALKHQGRFEERKVRFFPGNELLIEQLVLFPNDKKDMFDALDMAITAGTKRRRRKRRRRETEPGLI